MNLSFMSVGKKKQINPGLTYFVLTTAEFDSIKSPCIKSPSSKAEVQNAQKPLIYLAKIWLFYISFSTYHCLTSGKGCSFQTS